MSVFRSYFSQNNTLIKNNVTNNALNPVTEISYGTNNAEVTRFILDIDLTDLQTKIAQGLIIPNSSMKHVLHMTNTISYAPQYIGKKSYTTAINRASSFDLEFFNINQAWDGGSGYDLIYGSSAPRILYDASGNTTGITYNIGSFSEMGQGDAVYGASNWFSGKTNVVWNVAGAYQSGATQILSTQHFDAGNENIDIDITNYINQRLFSGYTGTTAFTGDTYGIGIKFSEAFEEQKTQFREAVAFHAKNTNTWYEPYLETTIDDTIVDDRNYFYLDKENSLYFYLNNNLPNVVVNKVEIYDHDGDLVDILSGSSIINVCKGIYKINLTVNSDDYPDAVLFNDKWFLTINGKTSEYTGDFYLISADNYYGFDNSNNINFDNYFFYFWGIGEKENIMNGNVRKIKLTIKELYPNQNNFVPLELEYRVFTTIGSKYQIDVIPFTSINRTNTGYYFNLDTSWLIPQDYYLQIRMKNGDYYENKQTLSFTVVSDGSQLFSTTSMPVPQPIPMKQFPTGFMYNNTLLFNSKTW